MRLNWNFQAKIGPKTGRQVTGALSSGSNISELSHVLAQRYSYAARIKELVEIVAN